METWGFENQRSLPGYGAGLFQTPAAAAGAAAGAAAANPGTADQTQTAAGAAGGMSPWLPIMMGVGMITQAGASVANASMNAASQTSIANAQANAMIMSTQAQSNASIFNAQSQAMVAMRQSDDALTAALDRNSVARMQIGEGSLLARFQIMASLSESFDQNFTAVQIATRGAQIAERGENNRHREAMEGLRLQEKQIDHPTIDTQDLLGRFA